MKSSSTAGYALALDDFVWKPSYRRLLELATIVKVDVLDRPASELDEVAQQLASYDVRLLAERVETAEVRAMCAGLGYELFQGYYFARPEMVKNRALMSDEFAIVQAMSVMRDARTTDPRSRGGVHLGHWPELQAAPHGELGGARRAGDRVDLARAQAQRPTGAEQMARAAARVIDRGARGGKPRAPAPRGAARTDVRVVRRVDGPGP